MSSVTWEIKQHIAKISKPDKNGWSKELNLISWNGRDPTYDLRAWSSDHSSCGKGISLSREDLLVLKAVLNGTKPIEQSEYSTQVEKVDSMPKVEASEQPKEVDSHDRSPVEEVKESTAFQQLGVSELFADEETEEVEETEGTPIESQPSEVGSEEAEGTSIESQMSETESIVLPKVEILEAPTFVNGALDFSNFKYRKVEVG